MSQHGFDVTHFGRAENWTKLCKEIGLKFNGPFLMRGKTYGFEWRNDRGLLVVTQANPETGQYGPGGRCDELGFASYIGATGPDYEVAEFAAAVRRHAISIKEERVGCRAYI